MNRRLIVSTVLLVLVASNAIAQETGESEKDIYRERGGVRIGYSKATSDLDKSFGAGLNLALHFMQRIKKPFSVDVTFGAIYLGSTEKREIFGTTYDNIAMRIITVTAAPMVEFPMNDHTNIYISGGVGLYTVSLLIDESIKEFEATDNHVGVNGGVGVFRQLSKNWFIDLNFQFHKFWTGDEHNPWKTDWIYFYSGGNKDPLFWAITGGVVLRLF